MSENSITVSDEVPATPTKKPEPREEKPTATDGKDWQAEAEKWKSLSRKNEEAAKANAAAAKRLEEIEQANASDLEKAVKKARDEGFSEARQAANARLVSAEARALAAEAKFIKPALAVKVLDLSDVTVNDNGDVDTTAIKKLLADLAADAPELIVSTERPRPKPDDAQGQTKTSTREVTPGLDRLRAAYAESTKK